MFVVAAFVCLKIPGLEPKVADENIYFYMATLIPKGLLPYKDFFYANPPGLLIFLSIAGIVFGNSFIGFKLVPLIAGAGSIMLTYLIVESRFSKSIAFLSSILLAFTFDWLRVTTHATGGNVTVFLILFSVLAIIHQKPVFGGLLFGLAFITKVYALTAFPAVLFLVFMLSTPLNKGGRGDPFFNTLKFILSFTLLVIIIFSICWIIGGSEFWKQSVLYHIQKPEDQEHNISIAQRVMRTNQPLTEFLGISILIFLWNIKRKNILWNKTQISILGFSGIWIITLAIFLSMQKIIFDQYFILGFPVAVIFITSVFYPLITVIEKMEKYGKVIIIWIIFALLVFMVWGAKRFHEHEVRSLNIAYEVAEYIKNNCNPTETIFGDSVTAPLLALLSGREISAYESDTNAMRFRSEISDSKYVLDRVLNNNVKFMVVRSKSGKYTDKNTGKTTMRYFPSGMFRVDVFGEELNKNWKFDSKWVDPSMKEYKIELYVKK
jgi:hypothetical protein